MTRRFTLLALLVLSAALFLACGGSGSKKDEDIARLATAQAFATSVRPSDPIPANALGKINVVLAGADYFVGRNNFTFGITDLKDNPQGGAKVKVTFYDLTDRKNPQPVANVDAIESAPGVGNVVTVTHANGETHTHGGQDDNRVAYYAEFTFPHAGAWGALISATLKDGTAGAKDIGFQVNEHALFPQPGDVATPSDNLTKADVADISEIDSGTPPNDMHDVKIKDAIAAHRPLVIVFSTPAYCTSRFCGPVNEEVEDLQQKYKGQVDFVHIEIWRNFEKREFNPTVREWLVQKDGGLTEPWVYVIGSDGVIYDRFEGPAGKTVVEPAVKAVAAGKTFSSRE